MNVVGHCNFRFGTACQSSERRPFASTQNPKHPKPLRNPCIMSHQTPQSPVIVFFTCSFSRTMRLTDPRHSNEHVHSHVMNGKSCCFCLVLFLSLSTAAHVQSLPHWFRLPTRCRKEAFIPLSKSRSSKARHQKSGPEGRRAFVHATVRHQTKVTSDLCSRKDAIRCQRPG